MSSRLAPPEDSHTLPARGTLAATMALALLLASVAGCDRSRSDADAIRALVAREVTAINARDMRALSEIWSRDGQALLFDVTPPGRFQGWEQIQRQWSGFFDRASEIHLTVEALNTAAEGTLGYATYDWSMTGRIGSYAIDDRGQATAIYRREKEGWKLVHAHFSPSPPPPAAEAPAGGPAESAPAEPPGAKKKP